MSKTLTNQDIEAIGKEVLSVVENCLKTFSNINATNVNDLMTVEELAEKLKITKQSVYKFIKSNGLNSIKIGKNIYVKSTEFDNYIVNKLR